MAHYAQIAPKLNQVQLTTRGVVPWAKVVRLLSAAAVALFLFAGTVHADIFVSNYDKNTVDKYHDDGSDSQVPFIKDANTAEGVQCVKLSSNEVYVASFKDPKIRVYNLSTGDFIKDFTITGVTTGLVALALNAKGDALYAADPYSGGEAGIWAVNVPIGLPGAPCTPLAPCHTDHINRFGDVIVGPDGNVYGTHRAIPNQGVQQFSPVTSTGWNPSGLTVIPGTSYNGHSFANAGAMIFDGSGNLWVSNSAGGSADGIFEFTGPALGFKNLNFTADDSAQPLGMDISPVNPPSPPFDSCKGCIAVAEFIGKTGIGPAVRQIDPKSCTGTIANPGICTFTSTPLIVKDIQNRPKYVRFTENCNDTGYVEICKMSCSTNPVSGYFDFTATNGETSSGPIHIPVNACSGPIQLPNGTVTIKETQQFGMLVTDITAYDYDYQGYQINALLSFNKPFQTGNVNVVSGDVSTETVAGFTNCKSGPGELKICKVAGGQGVNVGDPFQFTASGDPMTYTVPAGPPPNGYCVVGKSYDVGTPVLVTELPKSGTKVSNITVAPADRGGMQTDRSVIAIIDSGTTEVTFTNVGNASIQKRCLACR